MDTSPDAAARRLKDLGYEPVKTYCGMVDMLTGGIIIIYDDEAEGLRRAADYHEYGETDWALIRFGMHGKHIIHQVLEEA